jgi:hypothetical protein
VASSCVSVYLNVALSIVVSLLDNSCFLVLFHQTLHEPIELCGGHD